MPITLDLTCYPLVITTAHGLLSDPDYEAYLLDFRAATIERKSDYAHVYDGVDVQQMAPSQRKLQANYIVKHRAEIARYNRGTAFALRSPLTRGMLTAIHWMSPPPYPHTTVASRTEAIAWCMSRLDRQPVQS